MSFIINPYVFAGAGGVTSLSFYDVTYSIGATISPAAGYAAGDLLVLSQLAYSKGSSPSLVTPTDFTSWINITGSAVRVAVSYKIATGSEGTLTGMDGANSDSKILAVFRGDIAITSITASTPTTQVTSGNPSSQSIVATAGSLPLVALGIYANGGLATVNPRTMSPAKDGEFSNFAAHYMAYQLQNASLTDVSIDMDDEGSDNMLAGGWLAAA